MGCEIPVIKRSDVADPTALWIEGQLLRGRFIDAFARLETAVSEYISRLDLKPAPRAPFSHKLKQLTTSRERFCHPKKLDDRIKAIGALNEFRADLAHAELTVIIQYDESKNIAHWLGFQNGNNLERPLRAVTPDQLKRMTADASQLAKQFGQQQLKEATPAVRASAT